MTYTPINRGTLNWDVPLNAALAQLDSDITASTTGTLQAANNLSDLTNVAQAQINLGIPNDFLQRANNLSDLTNAATARTNLGLGYESRSGVDVFNVKDYSAVGDGVANDSAHIQAALDAANTAGGGQVYIPSGTYLCSTLPLRIYDNTRLTLSSGATMVKGSADTFLINGTSSQSLGGYTGHSNIIVEGGTWDNKCVTITGYSLCLAFGHAKNITVQNTTIKDVSGYHGIEFNAISGGRAINCRLLGMKHTGDRTFTEAIQIDLMKSSAEFGGFGPYDNTPCTDIQVTGCTFGASGTATTQAWPRAVGSHTAVLTFWHNNISVVRNTIDSTTSYAIKAYNWNQAVVANNIINGCAAGIWARSAETSDAGGTQVMRSVVIVGNNIANTTGAVDDGIDVQGESGGVVRDVTITGNIIDTVGTGQAGIRVEYVQEYTASSNTITDTEGSGISQENSDRGNIATNTIYTTGGSGITAVTCTGLLIATNILRDIGNNGIIVQGGSDISISTNRVKSPGRTTNATYYGLRCSTSADNIRLTDNIVRPNGSGNEAINALSVTNTCTNISRWGNDLFGATWTTAALSDLSTSTRTSPYDSTATGTNAGTATLNGTTEVTVTTAAALTGSTILLTIQTPAGTVGSPYVSSRVSGTSFGVKSTNAADTSTVGWLIIS